MMNAYSLNLIFKFKFPAGTSRGVLLDKSSTFIVLEKDGFRGIGECSTIPGLSIDAIDGYSQKVSDVCRLLSNGCEPHEIDLTYFPSIAFGLETALLDLKAKGTKLLFPSAFTKGDAGMPINGLVWMGSKDFMQAQIKEKIDSGYHCIKLKVGAIDFKTELEILSDIRRQFSPEDIEIRLDANGAFTPDNALERLNMLSQFQIHSIEQPIRQGQFDEMANLCLQSPVPIVLDEELIGIMPKDREALLQKINPAYIILKPSLIGGLSEAEHWIRIAAKNNTAWWITSALESNIGLNAIAQWAFTLHSNLPQGLGTGQLYHNNIQSPLMIDDAKLFYKPLKTWDLSGF